ncbi:MAG TPA: ATP phosphoribosyltransferase [Thermoanaerobaculia bacterium]|nr:ATP phosphoribosyltransferase [Thermoanaerobaculia bacterium]
MKPLRIAVAKGRLLEKTLAMFASAGFEVPDRDDLRSRRLVFTRGGVEWILVRDCDVPVYVDHGAAGAGVAGLDQILEQRCGAFQALRLPFGECRMMLIAAPGAPPLTKIATKYPRITRDFLQSRRRHAEIVPLGGSVELAAVLSLTSHVVDLVESGETVRIHNLEMQEEVAAISARLIVSKDGYRTDSGRIRDLIARVEEVSLAGV